MIDFELRGDFGREVIEESRNTPVVVDFWAEWCGPCRVLSPTLEKLALEGQGSWKLVKVDTEANPELAQALRIRSIPTVMMIVDGKRTAEFVGALPEKQVRDWLRQNLPQAAPDAASQAREALDAGDAGGAEKQLRKALEKNPEDQEARIMLARLLFRRDPDKAAVVAGEVPEDHALHPVAEGFRFLTALLRRAKEGSLPATPPEDAAAYRDGALAAAKGDYEKALGTWVGLISRNRTLDDDGARRACVAVFAVLGDDHPLTQEYRRRLANALY
jgi:putative thioredoxin